MTVRPPEPHRVAAPAPPRRAPEVVALARLLAFGLFIVLGLGGWAVWHAAETHRETVDAFVTDHEDHFLAVPLLSEAEQAQLRRSLNRTHVRLAEALGTEPIAGRDSLAAAAQRRGLVSIAGASPYYTAGRGTYSVPYLVPAAAAMLDTVGVRFHAALDSAGLPRYRFVVTSPLRSSEDQAALRGVNANAAAGHSSHEYGTTVDLTYRRYGFAGLGTLDVPAPKDRLPAFVRRGLIARGERQAREAFAGFAERYRSRLQALLGRALIALEDEGVLVALMERRQPVFHITVARAPGAADG